LDESDFHETQHSISASPYEQLDKGDLDDFAESIGLDFVAHVLGTTTLEWTGFKQFGSAFRSAFPDGRHVASPS
jgi:hypothetical protein